MKARCAICLRMISMVGEPTRTLREHNRRAKVRPGQEPERCPGSGQQPVDQTRIDVGGWYFGGS
jgi:hypothetical protein